jgi:hypothetical protein
MVIADKGPRRKARVKPVGSALVHISVKNGPKDPHWVAANLVDIILDGGCGLTLTTPLKPGSTVMLRGSVVRNGYAENGIADVRWCTAEPGGKYRAGLRFLGERSTLATDEGRLDCYAMMQLPTDADRDAISRAYRKLALRYHPDNSETGNNEMFLWLSAAYQVLSDPEKRARYDRSVRVQHWPQPKESAQAAPPARPTARDRQPSGVKYAAGWTPAQASTGTLRGWDAALPRF